jgi:hypothetical protein
VPGPNSSLEALTFWLVVATFLLALGTLGTAIAAVIIGVRLERANYYWFRSSRTLIDSNSL